MAHSDGASTREAIDAAARMVKTLIERAQP